MTKFVTVEGRTLKQAMKIISAVIERRNTITILGYAKLTHSDAGLRITGTNLDVEVHSDIDVIDGAGGEWSVCLDASVLNSIARVAGAMNLRIEPAADGKVMILLGDGEAFYEINTLPEADFPEIGGSRGDLIESFTNGMFAATIDKVAWCASKEEVRYYLNGVCWHITDHFRRFVATDGHRLSICQYTKEAGVAASRIIPRDTVAIIVGHLVGKDVKLFNVDDGRAKLDIVAPGVTIRTKLIDGSFPDYARVLPNELNQKFTFDLKRDEIISAIDQATAIGGEAMRAIKFGPSEGRITLERSDPCFGSAKVKLSSVWPTGPEEQPHSFGFNGRYIREIASRCHGNISLRMIDHGSPFTFHDDDKTMTRVLMPMRV